ncbi:hypothetical protein ACG9HA_002968, partial [Klebsiella aerogenes]
RVAAAPYPAYRMAFRAGPVARLSEAPPGNWMGDEAVLCRVAAAPYPAYRMAFRPGPVARLSGAPPGNRMRVWNRFVSGSGFALPDLQNSVPGRSGSPAWRSAAG